MMKSITLKRVRETIEPAHGWTDYYPRTNETIGPYDVNNLSGPTTGRYYDCTREWDTRIAVALAEEEFEVSLARHDIVAEGPWRDTVRSICNAVNAELAAEEEFERAMDKPAEIHFCTKFVDVNSGVEMEIPDGDMKKLPTKLNAGSSVHCDWKSAEELFGIPIERRNDGWYCLAHEGERGPFWSYGDLWHDVWHFLND